MVLENLLPSRVPKCKDEVGKIRSSSRDETLGGVHVQHKVPWAQDLSWKCGTLEMAILRITLRVIGIKQTDLSKAKL